MRMSEKCHNNNPDNPLTSRRTDGGIEESLFLADYAAWEAWSQNSGQEMWANLLEFLR